MAWKHKIKVFVLIVFLYAGHKLYNLYKTWIKPLLGVYKTMKGGDESAGSNK